MHISKDLRGPGGSRFPNLSATLRIEEVLCDVYKYVRYSLYTLKNVVLHVEGYLC